jgi:hypothetical protein
LEGLGVDEEGREEEEGEEEALRVVWVDVVVIVEDIF